MAKGNPILGTMQGTIGDVTTYNYNGKQVTRVRRRTIRNPRTNKQAIQRAIATTVSKFVSAFAPVLNNSLQSEGSKVDTLAKIRSLNMNMLRQLAAQNKGVYTPKGSMYVAPNAYIISRGTLAGINPLQDFPASLGEGYLVFDNSDIYLDDPTDTAALVFPTVAVGDQITFLVAGLEDIAKGSSVAYCRFAFKDNTTPALIHEDNNYKLNPAAIDLTKAEGPWDKIVFVEGENDTTHVILDALTVSGIVDCAGIIVSREDNKLRSNATMVVNVEAGFDYTLAQVYPTYMDGGTPIDIPSDIYLNNDANVI